MKKRIFSILLALVMVLGMLPVNAFAASTLSAALDGTSLPVSSLGTYEDVMFNAGTLEHYQVMVPVGTAEGTALTLTWNSGTVSDMFSLNNVSPLGGTYYYSSENYGTFYACEVSEDYTTVTPYCAISFVEGEISAEAENHAPMVVENAPTTMEATVGQTISVDLSQIFTDADSGDTLTYTLTVSGQPMTLNGSVFSGSIPTAGTYEVVTTASDGKASTSHTVTLTVKAAEPENNAPTVVENAPTTMETTVGQTVSVDLSQIFTDADSGDTLTYTVKIAALNLEQTLEGSVFSGSIPTAGTYEVVTTASDGKASASHTVTLTVKEVVQDTTDPCALTALEIGIGSSNATEPTQKLVLDFKADTTDYTVATVDYIKSWTNRVPYIKATAASSDAVITASMGSASATLTSASESWTKLVMAYATGYVYGSPLNAAAKNVLKIKVTAGEETKTYTVIIPIQADIANSALAWKTNLADGVYYLKKAKASLSVEAEYKNRPLDNEDVITYQWYRNTTDSAENGTAIEGANTTTYSPSTEEVGTTYYYVVASCNGLSSVTSNVITVTVTEKAAPTSITLVHDHPYTISDSWVKALDGKKFIATIGDSFNIKAVDENGEETPVIWTSNNGGGTFDSATGKYTVSNTSYTYLTAVSQYDSSITSGEKVIQVQDYKISAYGRDGSVNLSTDGQSVKSGSVSGGVSGYTVWTYEIPEGVGELTSDLTKKESSIKFNLFRPGTIKVSYYVELGDKKLTDSTTLTVNGIAVEDADGKLTKTYLETSAAKPNPTVQLKALSSTENATFTWSSADESIATVDDNGIVTAQGVGSVIISASDGSYTGGIKVVVTSADTPYFEALDFTTTSAWGTGLSTASWKTANFKPTTLEYAGLKLTKAVANTLTLKNTTLYNTDKYTAVATYMDEKGEQQSVAVNSGAVTNLTNIPLDTSTVTITLTDKTDATVKTVYTFEVTRPRDTVKQVANNGISLKAADGSNLSADLYNEKAEGYLFRTDAEGVLSGNTYTVSYNYYNYRGFLLNGRESFSVQVKGNNSNYVRVRYSTDDGVTWKELPQGGGTTDAITFPARTAEDLNPVVKVKIQVLDDQTYTDNVKAGKDGFADSAPNTYTVWAEQLPVNEYRADILTAVTPTGDWYPAFNSEHLNYRLVVPTGAAAPVLTYTVSEGATVKIGEEAQTPDASGNYTLTLTNQSQTLEITSQDGNVKKSYSFGYGVRSSNNVPDKVLDYLVINSQYTNGGNGGFGIAPEGTLTGGSERSLGNFGGYITYYYSNGLKDDPNNKFGIDFYVYGNANVDTTTSHKMAFFEPGQVWVSEDGQTWYALAGSEHYEDGTIWNYSVTYSKSATGSTYWVDNQGNSSEGKSVGVWVDSVYYPLNKLIPANEVKLSGILLPSMDGSITGINTSSLFYAAAGPSRFGYVDVMPNSAKGADANPYLENDNYDLQSSGFDLAWAVDTAGNPVDVSGKEFHYVKVVTASNMWVSGVNEKSTEVSAVIRTTAQSSAVGVTAAPTGVTFTDGSKTKTVSFEADQQVYSVDLEQLRDISITVNGTADSDNIYINNQRVASGEAATGFTVTKDSGTKLVRIIVQNGDKEPVIYLLKLTSSAEAVTAEDREKAAAVDEKIEGIGTVNLDSEQKITDARDAYKNLTSAQQSLVTKLSVLEEAEATLEQLKKDADTTDYGKVRVIVENTTYLKADGAPWDGQLVDLWVKLKADSTMMSVVAEALAQKGYSQTGAENNYITEINGLKAGDACSASGWMGTLNDWFTDQGFIAYTVEKGTLENGDEIRVMHTMDYGADVGSIWGTTDTGLYALNFSTGTLTPAFAGATLNYTLTVPGGTEGVVVTPTAKVKNFQVHTLIGETEYKRTATVPVEDGTVITIVVGTGPSMNSGHTPTTYKVVVAVDTGSTEADRVIQLIDAIGEVSEESGDAILAARSAYDALGDEKASVTNYETLLKAEADYKALNQAAANMVETLIAAIGTVTLDSEQKINDARTAYEALTENQQALVENYSLLTDAEEKLELLKLSNADILSIYQTTGDYLAGLSAPGVGTQNGEWRVLGLARAGRNVADAYYGKVEDHVASIFETDGKEQNGRLDENASTENSRLIVALTAIGKDVTDVAGYDLLSGLNEMSYIGKQGINGTIWALIAFDSHDYEIPAGDVTRDKLINEILSKQLADGGWALSGTESDSDITGMALQALAPYDGKNDAVTAAIGKALNWASNAQNADGSFSTGGAATPESTAQIITALTALGINPETDSRFVKNGVSAVDALAAYYVEGGGFARAPGGSRNTISTEQGYYALVSYYRLLQNKTSLYDMSDVTIYTAAQDQAAAAAVEALIDAIKEDSATFADDVKAAQEAYKKLTEDQQKLVSNYSKLTEALKKLADEEDKKAAEAVEKLIGEIGAVTLDSEAAIEKASAAYEKLTDVQKALVSNGSELEAAEKALAKLQADDAAANAVEKLIDAIGTVTKESDSAIRQARKAYDALTEDQQKLVENYKTLTDAEAKLETLKENITVTFTLLGDSKHGDNGSVHTLSGGGLTTWIAKKDYTLKAPATVLDVLELALKGKYSFTNDGGNYIASVGGLAEFTNGANSGWMYTLNGSHPNMGVAEQYLKDGDAIVFHYTDDYTKESGSQGYGDRDAAAAEKVEKLISNIGTVTLDSEAKIEAARKAYDALSYTQKKLVDNYDKLTAAETRYTQLKAADNEKKASAVEDLINAIKEGSAAFEDDVKAAQNAYNNLTADQKKLVGNYDKLTDYLKEMASEEDKEAAEAVQKLIEGLGIIDLDSEEDIKAARAAYDKLTDGQKALVSNLAALEAAEEKLAKLQEAAAAENIYKTTGDYLEKLGVPTVNTVGGEWMVIGLARSGRVVPEGYYENVVEYVQENIDENGRLHRAKSTDNARVILALTAIGKNVTDVAGHDLLKGLNNMEFIQNQGINGPIWALMAFDSGNYPVPEDGDVTREALIQTILDAQLPDGGWALSGAASDPDMTGMALQALAPYCQTNTDVQRAVEEALVTLSLMQAADGTYASIDGSSSESISQVIVALAALDIDADRDARFIKNGVSALDALCAFYVEGGGFKHLMDGSLDGMATEQGYYALTAYFRMLEEKTGLYNMRDVIDMGGDMETQEQPVETLPAETEPAEAEPVEAEPEGSSFPWWTILVIVAAGAVILVILLRRKKTYANR